MADGINNRTDIAEELSSELGDQFVINIDNGLITINLKWNLLMLQFFNMKRTWTKILGYRKVKKIWKKIQAY